ncbi:hypothetical protein [Candidatus Marimicrobium litorale]|uniref:Secreted protein n=1 Tax=Candidatus Marimicrobium litorale TaxID=2518991 RepID=A0ABT3T8Z8_9GAMM|nr:hypothetical protein [Candidatus Marimicrobium litorale]MCX2978753.1 hypothetical protein [Candidatus Marimicrobium litorale]
MQLPILKYIKLTITLIACSLASAQLFATSGSCGDPASLERLPPSKRALVEQRCNDRATRAVKEEDFHLEKQAWAAIYFAEKPAVRKVYNDKANMVNGCPGGFDDTNCDLDDLVTVF